MQIRKIYQTDCKSAQTSDIVIALS